MDSFLKCSECGGSYSTQKKLTRHMKTHSKNLLKCEECGKEVEGTKKLENHKMTHIILTCKHCEKVYPKTSLEKHMKSCSSNADKVQFYCDQCDYKSIRGPEYHEFYGFFSLFPSSIICTTPIILNSG